MSFRGGRGGPGGRPGPIYGLDIKPDFTPSERYPKFALPVQAPLTDFERRCVRQLLQFQQEVSGSAFYVLEKKNGTVEYEGGINDGIKRYSDRFLKKRKTGKAVTDHPYIAEFFPQELHSALGLKSSGKQKPIKLDLAEHKKHILEAVIMNTGDDEVAGASTGAVAEDENEVEEDDMDDQEDEDEFEEDEEGDYNAEKYFDDGEDDYGDDGGDDEAAY
ncbi:DNA-directed RNA polymerase III, subunit Rpc31 [Myxozyma melibiosi]|uniref:DNA-directed RNA polymerase III subunit n=1 Tax=Myxozyma melibiosi TaxID=54550 RepID=A0ABR1FBQ3_9ASCO